MIKQWQSALLTLPANMQQAIQVMNDSAIKIALVVVESNRLVGVITDGDIRRAILEKKGLETPVEEFMSSSPVVARETDYIGKVRHLLEVNKLLHIPIVNEQEQVIGLETFDHLMGAGSLKNPVFLMAGGFGTRLRPLTQNCPKPLLKVGSKPILETIISSFADHGFDNFYISVHYKSDMIKDYFKNGAHFGVNIDYIEENAPLGTAGALSLLPKVDMPVIVMNGDLLTKVDFSELLEHHNRENAAITMCVREYEHQVPYGVIKYQDNAVTNIVEKPTEKYFVNAGIYILSPEVVNALAANESLDMPDLINQYLTSQDRVSMFPIHEYWLDIGRMTDFERAQSDIANIL